MAVKAFDWLAQVHSEHKYLFTAIVTLILCFVTVPFELILTPMARPFRVDNPHIRYPYVPHEMFPVPLLFTLAVVVPIVGVGAPAFYHPQHRRHTAMSLLGLLFCLAMTITFIDVAKIIIGNQRPDFIARCIPKPGTPQHQLSRVLEVCTNTNMSMVWEGCKSTPSGHSGLSFAGLGFLAIYMHLLIKNHYASRQPLLKFTPAIPILVAMLIAYSRIIDHKHHWFDVIAGSSIGMLFAAFAYWYAVGLEPNYEPPLGTAGVV